MRQLQLRITILSAATFSILHEVHYGLSISMVLIMLIIKEPLLVFWATKITEGNQRIDREEQRQKIGTQSGIGGSAKTTGANEEREATNR